MGTVTKEMTWTTREGKTVPLSLLETSHLENILRFVRSNARNFIARDLAAAWSFLGTLRGEMAIDQMERVCNELDELLYGPPEGWFEYVHRDPMWVALSNEYAKRIADEETRGIVEGRVS
jgi:hypothetical protein